MPEPLTIIELKPLFVRTDTASVQSYAAAIAPDGRPNDLIPFYYPLSWLPDLAFRDAIEMADDEVLLHKSQSIAYTCALELECEYRLEARLHIGAREPAAAQFAVRLEADVREAGAIMLEMVSELLVLQRTRS